MYIAWTVFVSCNLISFVWFIQNIKSKCALLCSVYEMVTQHMKVFCWKLFPPHSAYFSFSFPMRRQTCEAFKSEKSPAANVTSRIPNRVMELFPNLVLTPHFLRVKVPFIILGWDMLWAWLQVLFHVLNTFVITTSSSMNLQRGFQWILSSLQINVNLDFWVQNLLNFLFPHESVATLKIDVQWW